jgi:prepilin-type N-terminal cleavage/methylation domain-containing protein
VNVAARKGYTLLEVMLAIAIGLLLVAALYIALDVQFRHMQTGRNLVAEGQLARGLLNRIAADIRPSLATLPANQNQNQNQNSNAQGQGAGGNQASGQGTTSSEQSTSPTQGTFNLGILGDDVQITLFVSTLPRFGQDEAEVQTGLSDLRRITYYLVPGQGLARQEVRNVMAGELNPEEEAVDLLGVEVVDLKFRYYDAQMGWLETWDGTTTGPPLAVEVQMAIAPPAETLRFGGRPREPNYYRMVVAIPGANIPPPQSTSGTTGTGGTP